MEYSALSIFKFKMYIYREKNKHTTLRVLEYSAPIYQPNSLFPSQYLEVKFKYSK
jgi:hypothetical protein